MPLCTTCTHPVPYLYTIYRSGRNLRLEPCAQCHAFAADPYIEHDTLTLLLDLILLKRGVYRHLLFNRGTAPRRETGETLDRNVTVGNSLEERERKRRQTIVELGLTLIMIDAFIRWSNHYPMGATSLNEGWVWNYEAGQEFFKILAGCFIETISFHVGITCCCALVLHLLNIFARNPNMSSAVRREFRLSHVPLTLLYSSLTKLFLLLMLSIWPENTVSAPTSRGPYDNPFINSVLGLLDEDKLDRQWIVRNVLGGMAAGFGLRVVLDCQPVFTALIILGGWGVKTSISNVASGWIGGIEGIDDAWLSYSIP